MTLLGSAKLKCEQLVTVTVLPHGNEFHLHGHTNAQLFWRVLAQPTLYF
jgi:hypothetical protein